MMRTPRIALLAAVVLAAAFGGQFVYGQDDAAQTDDLGEQAEALLGRLLAEDRGQTHVVDVRVTRPDAIELQSTGIEVVAVSFRPVDTTVDGVRLTADEVYVNRVDGVVEAEGNVTVTVTREDGSTVTMRTDRMTIEQGQ